MELIQASADRTGNPPKANKTRKLLAIAGGWFIAITLVSALISEGLGSEAEPTPTPEASRDAATVLATLPVKGRAPKTGYRRAEFGQRWRDIDRNGCDTRNDILNRDLTNKTWRANTRGCVVLSGILAEPYSGETRYFDKSQASAIQIDHVVALSDAWQKGAQSLSAEQRETLANDPLNLLAVDGRLNQQKSDGDAATWLPPNRSFRCAYVSRQIAVKAKYQLWVTPAERDAMARVLNVCLGTN